MSDKLVTLNDLGYVNRGRSKHRPRNAPELYGGPYPFVQTADIKHADLYLTEYEQTYSELGLAQSRLWPIGTLCITIAANIADTAILGCEACFPDSVIGFIPNEDKCDVRYVKYLFDTELQESFQQLSQGVAQDNLSKDKLLSVKFRIPDLPIQRRIADILSAYDDLIENNRRRIAILEETARLAYRKWFGGCEVRTVTLGEIADVVMGQSPESKTCNSQGEGLPFHQGVTGFGFRYPSNEMWCTAGTRFAEEGDILFSVRAPVGRINVANERIVIGRGLSAMKAKNKCQSWLLYTLKQYFSKEDMIGVGCIFASTTKKELLSVELPFPSEEEILVFERFASPIDSQIKVLSKQSAALAAARDMLLPRLMKGGVGL